MRKRIYRSKRAFKLLRHAALDETGSEFDERELIIGGPADDPKEK